VGIICFGLVFVVIMLAKLGLLHVGGYMICPFCGYQWTPRRPHSTRNPPTRCPRCRKTLPRSFPRKRLIVESKHDPILNKFLIYSNDVMKVEDSDLNIYQLKHALDKRIKERGLRLFVKIEDNAVYLTKH